MKRDGESFEYLGDPEATHSSRIGDFVTVGDEGFLDDAGRLYLTGRTVERLSSGGLKVYPAEIEEALTQDPAVIHAVATGVPDRCLGDRIVAAVTLRPRVKVNDVVRRLHALCRRQLAAHKRPTHILVCNIPCLENGKIDRVSAREILWSVHIPRTMTVNEA
jgi:long-chain acyl-CoA synthetase